MESPKPPPDLTRVHRLLRLLTLLRSGRRWNAADLRRELGVSRRTLFRDLDALRLAGVPVVHDRSTGYRIQETYDLPPVSLNVRETLGLMVLAKQAAAQRQRPLHADALSGIYKLIASVPEPVRGICAEMMDRVEFDPGPAIPGNTEARYYALLHESIDTRRPCHFDYTSPGPEGRIEGLLHPYLLHFANRAWYVMGWSSHAGAVRMFKLVRFESLEPDPRAQAFKRPARFRSSDLLGNAWRLIPGEREHRVELDFEPKVATNVAEVRWHATQESRPLPGGGVRLSFRIDGLNEIAWWVCGYADQVRVRRPAALRRMVREMHARAVDRQSESG